MLSLSGYSLFGALRFSGTSQLFHAQREADGQRVLLKIPVAPSPGPREREQYRREYSLLQRLQEAPGVIRAWACEEHGERPVLLLEDVRGELLSERLGQPLELNRAVALATKLAAALSGVHRRGVIHKDLKPSNILIREDGSPCLIDFGTATLQQVEHVDAAPPAFIGGTLAYMSPEQTGRMNRAVDYRTDFYSLGITLYELLTGRHPFQGRDALDWFHAHLAVHAPPLRSWRPELPPALSAIVMKLLAKLAEERYQSAEGLHADLERCQEALRRGEPADFALGSQDFPSRIQLPQRLYGRGEQAATLLQAFERVAQEGRPELVLISGYAGIGKSSVVNELHKPVVRRRGFFLSGKFDQLQQGIPYAPLAQALRELAQHLLSGMAEERERWRERLLEAWEGQGQVLVELVQSLEQLVGTQPPVQELPPSEAQNRFNRLFQKFLGVFATPQHPLVLFLDDLQWADLASLRLLHHLLTHPDTPPLLLIGAYRDNEVSPSHLLTQTLDGPREDGMRVTRIHLEPLSLAHVQQLVADTLVGAEESLCGPLAALLHEKTGGNPFFLTQLLGTLQQDGLLSRQPEGRWQWDADRLRAKGYSDDVLEFMISRLRQLPLRTQQLLELASCVGNHFPLTLLITVSGLRPAEVEQGLEQALLESLLARAGPEQYRFLHDRIQQAASALVPEQERQAVHLRIGRLLLASLSPEELRERLFDVVGQLNAARELISSAEERHRAARLNAEAGTRARSSAAFRSAATYFREAFTFLPGDPWETDAELAFKSQLAQASCEFMSGNSAETRKLVERLLPRAKTSGDLAALYRLKSEVHLAANEAQEAISCLLEGLARLGMPLPPRPSWEEVAAANAEVWALLGDRPIESLLELPVMKDPDMTAVMTMLAALFTPAFFTDNHLLILHLCRMVSISLRHGNSEAAVHGYSWYGLVLGSAFRRYRDGHAFGQLACELVERHGYSGARGKALYSLELISCWTRPLSTALELIRDAFHHAVQAGDFQVACYCCNHIVTDRLALGHPLEDVYQESVTRLDFARRAGFLAVQDVIHHTQRYVQQLRGLSRAFDTLSGEDFDEEAFEAGLSPQHLSTMRCWYWIIKMQSRFMCGAYEQAREASARAAELIWSSLGHIQGLDFHLYSALTLAACPPSKAPREQAQRLEAIRRHQHQLEEWAQHCPETFHAPALLVAAELLRLTGRSEEAIRSYEEAYQQARAHGFLQHAGLAAELAAKFWTQLQATALADAYARRAREAWVQWGAHGKVRQLDAQWPHLGTSATQEARRPSELAEVRPAQLDAAALVKGLQALSGELVLERLAPTVVRVALENTGARRGALLLPHGGALTLAALQGPSPEGASERTVEETLPWTLLASVQRTREQVRLRDTAVPHPFSSDAWLSQGMARWVLCLPLLRGEALQGVLYLESGVAPHAFPPSRFPLLEHLATQAALCLDNARRHEGALQAHAQLRRAHQELEQRLEERTWELRQARMATPPPISGQLETLANVLHDVGNVLTSATVTVHTLAEKLDASRVGRLKMLTSQLEEHRDDLGAFLDRDPQGALRKNYFFGLADELVREQAELRKEAGELNKQLEHLRAIVQLQRGLTRNTLLPEECELSELIESALTLKLPALQRLGISVTRELQARARVRLDKDRLLQILINLVSNARNALKGVPESQRHLRVRLETQDTLARIHVVDTGVGIAPEHRERLFSRGFTTSPEGQGLGLHSSELAARTLGGRLTLESEGTGKGTTATLELPLA